MIDPLLRVVIFVSLGSWMGAWFTFPTNIYAALIAGSITAVASFAWESSRTRTGMAYWHNEPARQARRGCEALSYLMTWVWMEMLAQQNQTMMQQENISRGILHPISRDRERALGLAIRKGMISITRGAKKFIR